jgi:Ca-activated chloride channel family protein
MFQWPASRKLRIAAAAGLAAALGAGVLLAQDPVIRVDVRLVHALAVVKNKAGQLVGGLTKDDFEIYDNGVKQEVAVFERQSNQPLSVAVLIDVSGSTAIDLKYEMDSGSRFFRALLNEGNPQDAVALYSFDYQVTLEQNFTHSYTVLQDRLKHVHGEAGTSLYDAIYLAARQGLESRPGRKAMVIITDGGNTTSNKDSHQALEAAQMADAVIYPVVVVPITSDAGRNTGGENVLTYMAQGTGGRPFFPASGPQIDRAFEQIISELRTEYLLGFYPHNVPLTRDRFHKLTIKVKQPDLQVSARNGYYGESDSFSAPLQDVIDVEPRPTRKKQ